MKIALCTLFIVLFAFFVAWIADLQQKAVVTEIEELGYGEVERIEYCVFDKGPYWMYSDYPVYYFTMKSGKSGYAMHGLFNISVTID